MAISLPSSPSYRAGRWRLASNATRFTSALTRTGQSVQRVGDFWACTMELPPIVDPIKAQEWAATLALMAGQRSAAYVSPPWKRSIGSVGTPRVNGVGLVGTALAIDGASAGLSLKKGDFLHYDTSTYRMLHMLTADVVLNGAGAGNLPILPAIRKSPADNALVTFSAPSCEMVLESPDVDVLSLSDSMVYGVSISFIEDVRE